MFLENKIKRTANQVRRMDAEIGIHQNIIKGLNHLLSAEHNKVGRLQMLKHRQITSVTNQIIRCTEGGIDNHKGFIEYLDKRFQPGGDEQLEMITDKGGKITSSCEVRIYQSNGYILGADMADLIYDYAVEMCK